MLLRILAPLMALLSAAVLAGCANQKQAQQSGPSSIIWEPEKFPWNSRGSRCDVRRQRAL